MADMNIFSTKDNRSNFYCRNYIECSIIKMLNKENPTNNIYDALQTLGPLLYK